MSSGPTAAVVERCLWDSEKVSIRFPAVEGSPLITQAPPFCASIVTIEPVADQHPGPLKIVEVYVDGTPRKFRLMDDFSFSVSPPIPFNGRAVHVVCEATGGFQGVPQARRATTPAPDLTYGLGSRKWTGSREAQQ